MRFISKSSNLLVVLRPGLPASPLTGTPARPTVSVRFKDGVAEVPDGELCDMMLASQAFNSDFVAAESVGGKDPYAAQRMESEPVREMTTIKYGTPIERIVKGGGKAISPEIKKIIKETAVELAKEMLPGMVEQALKTLVTEHEQNKLKTQKGKNEAAQGVKSGTLVTDEDAPKS